MRRIARLLRMLLRGLGYDLHRTGGNRWIADPFTAQRYLLDHLKTDDICIFDVGANRGQTLRRYRALFPGAQIYSFEPFPDLVTELRAQSARDPNLHVVAKAVSREKGVATFYVNEFDATNSLLPRPSSERRYYPKSAGPKETVDVETIDLDSFVKENGIAAVDILKFDIQGGELNALRGAESILQSGTCALIYTEIMFVRHYESAPLFHEIWAYLSQYGYSLLNIFDLHTATNGQLRYGDALFVNDTIRSQVIDRLPEEP